MALAKSGENIFGDRTEEEQLRGLLVSASQPLAWPLQAGAEEGWVPKNLGETQGA